MDDLKAVLCLFAGCVVATAALTPAVMAVARRVGAVDRGGYRKLKREEVPLLGGLAIAAPLILLALLSGTAGYVIFANWKWVWTHYRDYFDVLFSIANVRRDGVTLAIGGAAIVFLGLVDDTKGLRARWKLVGQIVVALFLCLSGYALTTVNLPFIGTVELGTSIGAMLTVLWVVGLINAFNLIDGIDGLASGIALIGAVALAALSITQQNVYVTFAAAAMAGCLLAFLFYNFPPAKIFLGDTGSMFLGYVLATLTLMGAQKSEAAVIILAPMLALSLPVFETLVSMLRRYLRGVPIFAGDSYHTHHRLLSKGYSQPRVVLTLCGAAFLLATAAMMSALIPETSRWVWSPYVLYATTLTYIAWLAGYLRPTTVRALMERRQRNKEFQALGRYASLRLNAGIHSAAIHPLLDLCRVELGLRQLELRMSSGKLLVTSSGSADSGRGSLPLEELLVKSADGQDVLIHYEAADIDPLMRQDVNACLAGIFDGIRLDEGQVQSFRGMVGPVDGKVKASH